MSRLWDQLMHMEHGWFARHQYATATIALALAFITPEVLPWI